MSVPIKSTTVALLMLASGCTAATSDSPERQNLSDEYQERLATEMEQNTKRPCDPVDPRGNCSAWKRGIILWGDLRKRGRAFEGQ